MNRHISCKTGRQQAQWYRHTQYKTENIFHKIHQSDLTRGKLIRVPEDFTKTTQPSRVAQRLQLGRLESTVSIESCQLEDLKRVQLYSNCLTERIKKMWRKSKTKSISVDIAFKYCRTPCGSIYWMNEWKFKFLSANVSPSMWKSPSLCKTFSQIHFSFCFSFNCINKDSQVLQDRIFKEEHHHFTFDLTTAWRFREPRSLEVKNPRFVIKASYIPTIARLKTNWSYY